MKLKKRHLTVLFLFLGVSIPTSALADENMTHDNLPMGYYTQEGASQKIPEENKTYYLPKIRMKSSSVSTNVPYDLYSSDPSLPGRDVVDISSYQSWMNQNDFNSLKSLGVKTIVVKLTQGTNYTNPYASSQIQMAKNAGLNVAVYHYTNLTAANSQASGNAKAIQEANYFINVAKKLGISNNTVMIMDCEQPYKDIKGNIIGPDTNKVDWATSANQFANQLHGQGYANTLFYTSTSWVGTNTQTCQMNYNSLGGAKKLWVAQYLYGKPSANALKNTQYGAWQYTSQMYFQGTNNLKSHCLDTSIDYKNVFVASSSPSPAPSNSRDIYRLYNVNTGEHFYTENFYEFQSLSAHGWRYEGIGWKASESGTAIYRVYNPNSKGGDHYYTKSKWEAQQLVNKGWRWDNNGSPAFYSSGNTKVYVAYNPNAVSGSHNYTTNVYEQNNLLNHGWKFGSVAWNAS
jgi:Lyzozyme M1 (1,4-beta-N-acetylmuramidase)